MSAASSASDPNRAEAISTMPTPDQPSIGFATAIGTLATLLGLIGGVIAAIDGNDVATAGAAAGSILALITTLGGRYAQATAKINALSVKASPWIDEAQRVAEGIPTTKDPTLPPS